MTDVNPDTAEAPRGQVNSPPPGANGAARSSRNRVVAERAAAMTDEVKRWPLSRIVGVAVLALLLFSVAAMVVGGIALLELHSSRKREVGMTPLDVAFIVIAIGLAVIVALLALGLRATAIRPLHRLAAEARRVAGGDFEHEVSLRGPREVT